MASEGSQEVSSKLLFQPSSLYNIYLQMLKQLPKNPNPPTNLAILIQSKKLRLSPHFLLFQLEQQAVHGLESPRPHLPLPPLLLDIQTPEDDDNSPEGPNGFHRGHRRRETEIIIPNQPLQSSSATTHQHMPSISQPAPRLSPTMTQDAMPSSS
jgi:hypothetical protein